MIKAPVRAPKARAHAERWVGSLRRECLDRLLILGRRHLEHVLRIYRSHGCSLAHLNQRIQALQLPKNWAFPSQIDW